MPRSRFLQWFVAGLIVPLLCMSPDSWSTTAAAVASPPSNPWEKTLPDLALKDLAAKYGRNSTTGLSSLLLSAASPEKADEAAAAEVFAAERASILKAMQVAVKDGTPMDDIVNRTETLFRETLARYHAKHPQLKELLQSNRANTAAKLGALPPPAVEIAQPYSFLEMQSSATASSMEGGCEVCVYVLENKQMRQPFLCRGLKAPQYQQVCVSVLVSMMWWLENEVYWVNYGCQRQNGYVCAASRVRLGCSGCTSDSVQQLQAAMGVGEAMPSTRNMQFYPEHVSARSPCGRSGCAPGCFVTSCA